MAILESVCVLHSMMIVLLLNLHWVYTNAVSRQVQAVMKVG